jgi:hypothetical protein
MWTATAVIATLFLSSSLMTAEWAGGAGWQSASPHQYAARPNADCQSARRMPSGPTAILLRHHISRDSIDVGEELAVDGFFGGNDIGRTRYLQIS